MIPDGVRTVVACVVGAVWVTASAAKVLRPEAAWEFAARTVPTGVPPRVALAVVVGVEAAVGVAMLTRAVRSAWPSLALLATLSAVLFAARADVGADLPCGCFGALLGTTVGDALVRNAALAALHVALIVPPRRAEPSGRA